MKKFFAIFHVLSPLLKSESLGDYLLDKLEDYVLQTDNTIDDKLVLPAIKALRISYEIPENEDSE